jgi:hypothetical protein
MSILSSFNRIKTKKIILITLKNCSNNEICKATQAYYISSVKNDLVCFVSTKLVKRFFSDFRPCILPGDEGAELFARTKESDYGYRYNKFEKSPI